MPVLNYGDPMTPLAIYRAQIAVRSVMAWPDPADEESRREYIATVMSKHLGDLSTTRSTLSDPLAEEGWENTISAIGQHEALIAAQGRFAAWFEEAGGHASVSTAPGFRAFQSDFQSRVGGWFAAGLILALVRRMAAHHADLPGGASINKALFILQQVQLPGVPRNSFGLREAWRMYKPVSHFCAVLFDLFMIAYERNETPDQVAAALETELSDNFLMFLAKAEGYLGSGLTHQPLRAKAQTLLNPVETWVLPQHRMWPDLHSTPSPLSGPLLEAALEYRAPIPSA